MDIICHVDLCKDEVCAYSYFRMCVQSSDET